MNLPIISELLRLYDHHNTSAIALKNIGAIERYCNKIIKEQTVNIIYKT